MTWLRRRVGVGDDVAVLGAQLRDTSARTDAVDRLGMAGVVGRVVRQRAEREGVLVDVLRVADQRLDEVAGARRSAAGC